MCAFVHGFEPYFLVQAPDRNFSLDDCEALRGALNVRRPCVCRALETAAIPCYPMHMAVLSQAHLAQHMRTRGDKEHACVRVELVPRQTIMHYQPAGKQPFIKVVLASPNLVPKAKGADNGMRVISVSAITGLFETTGLSLDTGAVLRPCQTYESNVLFVMRYMVDHDIVGASWVELPSGTYTVVNVRHTNRHVVACTVATGGGATTQHVPD